MNPPNTGRVLLAVSLAALFGHSASAAILNVPSSFSSLQAAVNAAADGDEIVLAPGTYVGAVNIASKSITIRGNTADPTTVSLQPATPGTILRIENCTNLRLQGLQLRNGTGSRGLICGSAGNITLIGGAITTSQSGLEITQCTFTGNTADIGGTIFMEGGSLTIRQSTFTANGLVPAPGGTSSVGAVLRTCDRSGLQTVLIEDSVISGNGDLSGGLGVITAFNTDMTVRRTRFEDNRGSVLAPLGLTRLFVESCSFLNNSGNGAVISTAAAFDDAVISVDSSWFTGNQGSSAADILAAMPAGESTLTVTNSHFTLSDGTAIAYTQQPGGSAVIDRCEFRGGNSVAIATFAGGGTTRISNSLIAGTLGDGLIISGVNDPATTTIDNCTIVGNANFGVRPEALLNGELLIRNSILTGNAAGQIGNPVIPIGQTILVTRSIVQGGRVGVGNLDVNPGFVSPTGAEGDYRLLSSSPAIDSGDSSFVLPRPDGGPALDLDANPRRVDVTTVADTGVGAPVVDRGAFEFTPPSICIADFNNSNAVDVQDILDFITAWLARDSRSDVNNSGNVTVQDLLDFFTLWLARC